MPFTGAEAVAASALTFLACAIASAYVADFLGFAIVPPAVLLLSITVAGAAYVRLRPRASVDARSLAAFAACVAGTFAWLLWLARPDFLPTGSGPDLAHHLALIEYIQRHHALVHDPGLGGYLGEMTEYTPGSHLLAVLFGAWFRSDGLHAVHPTIAGTVALKAGFVYLIAARLLPREVPRLPFAIIAVLLLFVPRVHFVGSFTEQSYLAQVVAELFAVAMWWAMVVWDERPHVAAAVMFAVAGVAAFLTWPVWTGPVVLAFGTTVLLRGETTWRRKAQHLAIATLPIGAAAAMHGSRHASGFRMVGTGGFAIWPTPDILGWWYIALAAAGLAFSVTERRGRGVALLAAAILLQTAALYSAARSSGAETPYLSLKMFYLAVHPIAVGVTLLLAAVWRVVFRALRVPERRIAGAGWALAAIVGVLVARPLAAAPRPRPIVTQAALDAARWAEKQAPPGCIDYLVVNGYTAYWLHVSVYGQPRGAGRAMDENTFNARESLVRWILPDGLPYAVADDLEALPRDVRANVDVLARFGPAAVVKRRGPSKACE